MSASWAVHDDLLDVLVVCTGNVCRSPLVERMMQSGFDAIVPGAIRVHSAGTQALVGSPTTQEIAGLAEQMGIDMGDFRAQQLQMTQVQDADLVLALDRGHRATVVELVPQALRKTFTLRELARILPQVPVERGAWPQERWRSAVVWAARRRRAVAGEPDADDVVDPYRQPDSVLWEMAGQLVPAADTLVQWERRAAG